MLIHRIGTVPGLGGVGLSASDHGLAGIRIEDWSEQPLLSHRRIGIVVGEHPIIDAAIAQLGEFVLGRRREFHLACDFAGLTPTRRAVLEATRRIPWGATRTYSQIAAGLGLGPESVRSVVETLLRNPFPLVVPCHRVIAGRDLGRFIGGTAAKRQLLALEGVDARHLPEPVVAPPTSTWIRQGRRMGA